MNFLVKHKRRLIWSLLTLGLLWLFSALFWVYATPYNHVIDKKPIFYIPEKVQKHTHARATVESVEGDKIKVKINDGYRKGDTVEISRAGGKDPKPGDRILIGVSKSDGPAKYMTDFWRLPGVLVLAALFIWLVIVVGGKQGLMSMMGLLISIVVIGVGLVPAVLNGANAFWASVVAAFVIAILAILTAHGWRWRTIVSLISIFLILALAVGFALLGGWLGSLTGIYDDTSVMLHIYDRSIDMRGVLVGGIIIATLGVLDDIVTAQTAAIDEIHKAQPKLNYRQLFSHGQSVGREHVAALVNTLALAYVGVSLPVVLSMVANFDQSRSILMLFNSEFLSQEIVRTLVSSMALVVAVPASTAMAALLILRKDKIFAILKPNKRKSGGSNAAN
ncbi:YibE/F family protein [Candidatus Saccharibacteria bacterium]|nr:YibE/F family protein [Candidatus Saccharibacteria bacterium]